MAEKPSERASTSKPKVSVESFIASLAALPEVGHVLTVMVKAADRGDGVMLAHVGDCRHWVHIPVDAIETIRENGRIHCGAHTHPVADIELKSPATSLEQAYSALAHLHIAKLGALTATDHDQHGCIKGQQHWGKDSSGNWGCQPGP